MKLRAEMEPGKGRGGVQAIEVAENERGGSTWIYSMKGKDAVVRQSRWWLQKQIGDQRRVSQPVR